MTDKQQSQEKTEQPTPKRLEDARKKGQVARSKELNTAVVLLMGSAGLVFFGDSLISAVSDSSKTLFGFDRQLAFDVTALTNKLQETTISIVMGILPYFMAIIGAILMTPFLLGSWSFSGKAIKPQFGKLNPAKGLKKMFSVKSVVELVKAFLKFVVVSVVTFYIISNQYENIGQYYLLHDVSALKTGFELISYIFIGVCASLIAIVAIDVPYQLYDHNKKLKMTKNEVKDEMKETEGKPEVKSVIKKIQRQLSQRRMMQDVPKADVVLMNPTHFAVAIKYDELKHHAPYVVAKGSDLLAFSIEKVAKAHNVEVIRLPMLTRAIYFNTEINQEVPNGLFVAIAHVLAYIYQLKSHKTGKNKRPVLKKDLPIPDELRRD